MQVVFEAQRGNGMFGDIAIDDVLLQNGACASPGTDYRIRGRSKGPLIL